MAEDDQIRAALKKSLEFSRVGEMETALDIVDVAIAAAITENQIPWVVTLSHHAAVLCDVAGDIMRKKRYYEQSLSFQPENAMALYGLANVALKQGETDVARQYAARCYQAIVQSNDPMLKAGLLDLVVMQFPELAGS